MMFARTFDYFFIIGIGKVGKGFIFYCCVGDF